MSVSEVLVTGGTGVLGRRVVERLGSVGVEARVLSRSGRPGTIRGDLLTGEGLNRAVHGAETIIHCASSPFRKPHQIDVEGTGRLLEAAAGTGVSHFVYISIVGIDRVPSYPYYRTKLDTERVVESSPVPYTILRATQFYDLVLEAVRFLDQIPVVVVPRGFLGQPIDAGEVAERLVELALSEAAGRVRDVGGAGGPDVDRRRPRLLRGHGTAAEDLRGSAAWQDGACVSRGRADVSGPGLRRDPLGGVSERNGQSCRTEDARR